MRSTQISVYGGMRRSSNLISSGLNPVVVLLCFSGIRKWLSCSGFVEYNNKTSVHYEVVYVFVGHRQKMQLEAAGIRG